MIGWRQHALAWALAVAGAVALALNALTAGLNHDESQYVAGPLLTAAGLNVFDSFMSLQPPLQTWVYAPVAWLFPFDSFVAMRLFSAVLALGTLALVYAIQRRSGVPARAALLATGAMVCCGPFLMTGAVVRNDMLAAFLATAGMAAVAPALRTPSNDGGRWLAGGVCFGLALSTKLSFAPYGLFAGLFLLRPSRPHRYATMARFAAGAALGLLPAAAAAWSAPASFLWGVLTYASSAPFDHYLASGMGDKLGFLGKAIDLVRFAWQGPMLAALLAVIVVAARRRLALPRESAAFFGLMLAGGLAGAAMPSPAQRQYLLTAIPPLFVLLGASLPWLLAARHRRILALGTLTVFMVVGLAKPTRAVLALRDRAAPTLALDRQATWIGRQVRASGHAGMIATVSPHRIAGSGYMIDPHFATGPFVLRSGHLLADGQARALNVVTPATMGRLLAARPPAGVLSGYERAPLGRRADRLVDRWAAAHGYRALRMPDGIGTLHVCDGALVPRIGCLARDDPQYAGAGRRPLIAGVPRL